MGCFLGCFGSSKNEKKRSKIAHNHNNVAYHNPNVGHQYNAIHQAVAAEQDNLEQNVPPPESRVESEVQQLSLTNQPKQEEQLTLGARKKVTFDSNVKEYVHISYDEAPKIIQEIEKDNEKGIDVKCMRPGKFSPPSESGSTLSSLGSYPPIHRYENCRESDDEDEELDCEVSDLDEDEDEYNDDVDEEEGYDAGYSDDEYPRQVQESSTRSCSSLESGAKNSVVRVANDRHSGESIVDHGSLHKDMETPPGFYCGARDRSGYVHSVLHPVENTAQWKTLKAKQTPQLRQQKENSQIKDPGNNHPLAVDTSLSTWLISFQKTPPGKATPIGLDPISCRTSASSCGSNSVISHQERPILGALPVEELKQLSASSSPRRSPCRGPNDKPLLGTVGVHWNNRSDRTPVEDSGSASSFKGIPNTTSKYREDKRIHWHSTPFETRLERALNKGAADSCT